MKSYHISIITISISNIYTIANILFITHEGKLSTSVAFLVLEWNAWQTDINNYYS